MNSSLNFSQIADVFDLHYQGQTFGKGAALHSSQTCYVRVSYYITMSFLSVRLYIDRRFLATHIALNIVVLALASSGPILIVFKHPCNLYLMLEPSVSWHA